MVLMSSGVLFRWIARLIEGQQTSTEIYHLEDNSRPSHGGLVPEFRIYSRVRSYSIESFRNLADDIHKVFVVEPLSVSDRDRYLVTCSQDYYLLQQLIWKGFYARTKSRLSHDFRFIHCLATEHDEDSWD